jgi:hypothetical protein
MAGLLITRSDGLAVKYCETSKRTERYITMAKQRTSYDGLRGRIVETQRWGVDKAKERYGTIKQASPPSDYNENKPQAVGDRNNLQGPGYDNPSPGDWLRGGGESAQGKPRFDRMQARQPQPKDPAETGPGARSNAGAVRKTAS